MIDQVLFGHCDTQVFVMVSKYISVNIPSIFAQTMNPKVQIGT